MISNKKIDALFEELGYIKQSLSDNSTCYVKGNLCCRFEHSVGLNAYILSSAENYKDANNNLFEDDELYADSLKEIEILDMLKANLKEYFSN